MKLHQLLELAAVAQLGVAILNLFIVRLLRWKPELEKMPLLVREVFQIHTWFISVILTLFGVMTLRFAGEMALGTNAACAWLTAGIGIFWGIRTVLQVTHYSSSHWRGQTGRTIIHFTLLLLYGAMATTYFFAAWKGGAHVANP